MLYESQRQHMVKAMADLKAADVLNNAGGAISVRPEPNHVVISTSGSASRGWNITAADHIVLDLTGDIIEQTAGLGVAGTPLHLAIYQNMPDAGAVLHAHAPYSLAFASLGQDVPSVTNRADLLGPIPCLSADDSAIKAEYRANPTPVRLPAGVPQRPEVYLVNMATEPQLKELIANRGGEVGPNGMAFTLYRHGAVVVGRDINQVFDLLLRVEESARTAILQTTLTGGKIQQNPLYGMGS